ncbi:alanine--tRNA ligase [Clostridium sp. CAG:1013]|nr:alanine--tRNA ligase [Clostridium sp. CAG:1013]
MQWTGLNELREKFLEYFESKGHLRLPSFSLIPQGDNSLLLINSGMAPMKNYFTGEVTPPRRRVTTCQKCIRTGDIENVGYTDRHGTFFEMLGNFSFGDYFKREAISFAWEFFTQVLEMPKDKLYISVYENDDEAWDIWTKEMGVEESHMKRLGKEDNFWEHGSGPCGPCSEIYFDRGEEHGCGKPDCGVGCECDRFVEVWNNVFSQFNNDGHGNYTDLAQKNIDTGMGLERLACVMQGVDNLFLVDTVQNIMKKICEIAGVKYGEDKKKDVSLRVITDHIRSTVFMIGDGVLPSNEGRGYVLRRLLRRAARHGKLLGIQGAFLKDVVDTVIQENQSAYPELLEKRETIKKIVSFEEESFQKTIDQGMALLNELIDKADTKVFSGEHAFTLNDTYGFPLDLTKEILAERGMEVDEQRFRQLMQEQRERARNARKDAGADAWKGEGSAASGLPETVFTGYDRTEDNGKVIAIIQGGKLVESADQGAEVSVVLDKTPFYGEGGGQVGDSGVLESEGVSLDVVDTSKHEGVYLHRAVVSDGTLNVGDALTAKVDAQRRGAIMRNHTAAHLLQAALRQVLGSHVEQAGQLVNEHHVRFDFTHFSALTPEELAQVELLVNQEILKAVPVSMVEMGIEEARQSGAMALFGEKYGDVVRVVSVEDGFSKEFCGGTHMDNTARLGLFKIVSESSVASGVRRIEGVTGMGVLDVLAAQTATLRQTAQAMKVANPMELPMHARQMMTEIKDKDKTIDTLNAKLAQNRLEGVFQNAQEVEGVKVVYALLSGTGSDALRALCDKAKERSEAIVAVFAGVSDGKATLAAVCSKAAQEKGLKAGVLVKEVAQLCGGNGGGRPDFAMAGAKDQSKLDDALAAVPELVKKQIG